MANPQRKAMYREALVGTQRAARSPWNRDLSDDEGWYDPGDDYFDDDYDPHDEYERDEWEDALQECGQTGSGWQGCLMAGTEHCDFDCPFRDMDLGSDDDE